MKNLLKQVALSRTPCQESPVNEFTVWHEKPAEAGCLVKKESPVNEFTVWHEKPAEAGCLVKKAITSPP
jgi:hypothetical protein